jgi:hypothetical protein
VSTREASIINVLRATNRRPDTRCGFDKRVFRAWRVASKVGSATTNLVAVQIEISLIEDSLFTIEPQHTRSLWPRAVILKAAILNTNGKFIMVVIRL